MAWRRIAGSFNAAHTRSRGAAILYSPDMSIRSLAPALVLSHRFCGGRVNIDGEIVAHGFREEVVRQASRAH
jgi:hypothetical protein